MNFGMKRPIDIDADGYAHVPEAAGIGVEWDWDFIENCTISIL
jgi:L-alanine-DL-glutamate epimerase-like enolase superfamily enzyme